jgi:hypothetical protein
VDNGIITTARYGSSGAIVLRSAAGTQASPTAISSNTSLSNIVIRGYDGTTYRDVASIGGLSDGAISSTSSPGYITFNTTPSGSVSSTERMRIDSSGNVGIGTTSNASSSKLDTRGRIRCGSGNSSGDAEVVWSNDGSVTNAWNASVRTDVGGSNNDLKFVRFNSSGSFQNVPMQITQAAGYLLIDYTASNGAYKLQVNSQIFATSATIATSDARYKTNIEPITTALSLVNQLNPVSFDWKEHPVHDFPEGKTIGFLAQEVKEVLKDTSYVDNIIKENTCTIEPEEKDKEGNITKEAVTEEFLGIAEGNLIPLLTKAIQEQQTIINDLKARIETLEGK